MDQILNLVHPNVWRRLRKSNPVCGSLSHGAHPFFRGPMESHSQKHIKKSTLRQPLHLEEWRVYFLAEMIGQRIILTVEDPVIHHTI